MEYADLHDEQKEVYNATQSFLLEGPKKYRMKRIKAVGGTGKTFTIKVLVKDLMMKGIVPIVASFTGRATTQLSDDVVEAVTLHKILYKPRMDENGNLMGWTKNSPFEVNSSCDCIVIDEGSMIPYLIWEDIVACDVPVVVLGDHFQLPPVETNKEYKGFNLMDGEKAEGYQTDPDSYLLTNRRTDPSYAGIVDITARLRESKNMPMMKGNGLRMIDRNTALTVEHHRNNTYDITLCGTNKTRHRFNRVIRKARGYTSDIPEVGEQVICLKNDIIAGGRINNGEIFRVEQIFPIPDEGAHKYVLTSIDDNTVKRTVNVKDETWDNEKSPFNKTGDTHFSTFAFGYCISTHKSQGGTFDSVLFFDEDVSFFIDQQRFRYTACSRAATHLTIAR